MSLASNSETEARYLVTAVERLLKQRVDAATEEVVKDAVTAFESRLRREIATAAMEVSNFYEMDTARGVVSIRVKIT